MMIVKIQLYHLNLKKIINIEMVMAEETNGCGSCEIHNPWISNHGDQNPRPWISSGSAMGLYSDGHGRHGRRPHGCGSP
jgi:hypothetical protein